MQKQNKRQPLAKSFDFKTKTASLTSVFKPQNAIETRIKVKHQTTPIGQNQSSSKTTLPTIDVFKPTKNTIRDFKTKLIQAAIDNTRQSYCTQGVVVNQLPYIGTNTCACTSNLTTTIVVPRVDAAPNTTHCGPNN